MTAASSTSTVLWSPWAMKDICRLSRESVDGKETGGILLGFDATLNEPLTLTQAGDAGPGAVRGATHFRRDIKHAQALADAAWMLDGSLWVGDWHTHPAGHPAPSSTDLRSYRSALNAKVLRVFLSIIVSPDGPAHDLSSWDAPEVRAWLVSLNSVDEAEVPEAS